MRQLIENALVWDGQSQVETASILVQNEKIVAVGREEDFPPSDSPTERIDGEGRLAIPGLVNAHTHLYSSLARGMALPGFAPTSFTEILQQLWWRLDKALDPDSVRASALIGAMEAARCGCTTLVDHHASPSSIPGSLDLVADAVCKEVGLRASLSYEVSDRDGLEKRAAGIEENVRFGTERAPAIHRMAPLFGLHASFTLSDETLSSVAERLPEGMGVHIHVAEGPEDETLCEAEHGLRIVRRLDRFGLLRPSSVLAHCLHLDESEKELLAERGSIVVHNPRSNMNNAVGAFDLAGFLDRGVLTGLGTDGLGCNLLAELFTAGLLQKHSQGDVLAGGFPQLERLLFVNNPAIAERLLGAGTGRIAPGAQADIVLLDYVPPTPLVRDTLLGHLLFGVAVHSLRVSDLWVAGRAILRNGRFVEIDEAQAYAHAREAAHGLWARSRARGAR
jgi:putative selenium metabolism protein SsnA